MLFKNNPSLKIDYENYKERIKHNERYIANEFIFENNQFNQFLFICMVGKTGDNTLKSTFSNSNIPHHFTFHTPLSFNKSLLNNINGKVKIITAVRDPLSINLSSLYECLGLINYTNVIFEYKLSDENDNFLENGGDVQKMYDYLYNDTDKYTHVIEKFMENLKESIIDLSKYPFDKEKGYSIIKEGNIEVFVYQLEKMNDIVKEISDWIGANPFDEWKISNTSENKWISKSYNQAKKEIKISQKLYDVSYNNPWIEHFYSQEDIQKFKNRWSSHIKD